jgi:hypothetical protein
LIIAGMHRSGTSAIARFLAHLGVDPPQSRLHTKGGEIIWGESRPIARMNEEVLVSAGSSWDDVSPFPSSWHTSPVAAQYRTRMVELLVTEYTESNLFLIKDPRICRLIPFWLEVLAELDARPAFVLPLRNPLEVAASLSRRNRFSVPKGLLLWLRHVLDAERDTRGYPRAFVLYDDLLRDWRSVARSVSTSIGINWPQQDHEGDGELDRFLSPAHRQHTFTPNELSARREVVSWVAEAHALLLDACRIEGQPDQQALDHLSAVVAEADLAYGPVVVESRLEAASAEEKLDRMDRELKRAEETLREARERFEAAEELASERQLLLRSVERFLSWRLTRPLRFAKAAAKRARTRNQEGMQGIDVGAGR